VSKQDYLRNKLQAGSQIIERESFKKCLN
jgi:hypothetical protein